jgi:RNA polymerase sigma-70 factor, ECF subfamily
MYPFRGRRTGETNVGISVGEAGLEHDVRELVERGRGGDSDALEALYILYADRVHRYLRSMVLNAQDAEDLTNQTFTRMLERIDRFEARGVPFSAWLFRIAKNLAIDHFRASARELPDPVEDSGCSAEEEAMRAFGRFGMRALIEPLSEDQRRVLALKYGLDFSNGEVACLLGKSEGAIKSLQHRAFASLERQLGAVA